MAGRIDTHQGTGRLRFGKVAVPENNDEATPKDYVDLFAARAFATGLDIDTGHLIYTGSDSVNRQLWVRTGADIDSSAASDDPSTNTTGWFRLSTSDADRDELDLLFELTGDETTISGTTGINTWRSSGTYIRKDFTIYDGGIYRLKESTTYNSGTPASSYTSTTSPDADSNWWAIGGSGSGNITVDIDGLPSPSTEGEQIADGEYLYTAQTVARTDNSEGLEWIASGVRTNITEASGGIDAFSSTETYALDALVIEDNHVWINHDPVTTAGAFDAGEWNRIPLDTDVVRQQEFDIRAIHSAPQPLEFEPEGYDDSAMTRTAKLNGVSTADRLFGDPTDTDNLTVTSTGTEGDNAYIGDHAYLTYAQATGSMQVGIHRNAIIGTRASKLARGNFIAKYDVTNNNPLWVGVVSEYAEINSNYQGIRINVVLGSFSDTYLENLFRDSNGITRDDIATVLTDCFIMDNQFPVGGFVRTLGDGRQYVTEFDSTIGLQNLDDIIVSAASDGSFTNVAGTSGGTGVTLFTQNGNNYNCRYNALDHHIEICYTQSTFTSINDDQSATNDSQQFRTYTWGDSTNYRSSQERILSLDSTNNRVTLQLDPGRSSDVQARLNFVLGYSVITGPDHRDGNDYYFNATALVGDSNPAITSNPITSAATVLFPTADDKGHFTIGAAGGGTATSFADNLRRAYGLGYEGTGITKQYALQVGENAGTTTFAEVSGTNGSGVDIYNGGTRVGSASFDEISLAGGVSAVDSGSGRTTITGINTSVYDGRSVSGSRYTVPLASATTDPGGTGNSDLVLTNSAWWRRMPTKWKASTSYNVDDWVFTDASSTFPTVNQNKIYRVSTQHTSPSSFATTNLVEVGGGSGNGDTYELGVEEQTGDDAILLLDASSGTDSRITFQGGNNISINQGSSATEMSIAYDGPNPARKWATGTVYALDEVVFTDATSTFPSANQNRIFRVSAAHTAPASFSTDNLTEIGVAPSVNNTQVNFTGGDVTAANGFNLNQGGSAIDVNLQIGSGAVGQAEIASQAVTGAKMFGGNITGDSSTEQLVGWQNGEFTLHSLLPTNVVGVQNSSASSPTLANNGATFLGRTGTGNIDFTLTGANVTATIPANAVGNSQFSMVIQGESMGDPTMASQFTNNAVFIVQYDDSNS